MRQAIVLGTAQWGQGYGITNPIARLSDSEVLKVLETAQTRGIRKLDTASGYQDAEIRVTELAPAFDVQTKIPALNLSPHELQREVSRRVARQPSDRQLSILIHDWSLLDEPERISAIKVLSSFRDSGDIARVGISVYEEAELMKPLDVVAQLDVIQIPISLLDQRLVLSSTVRELRKSGVCFQARSIFLQGLLLRDPVEGMVHPEIAKFRERAEGIQYGRLGLCIGFIKAQDWIDEVVLGVTTEVELTEIFETFIAADDSQLWDDWASTDVNLLDPRTW